MQHVNLTTREFIDKVKEVKETGGWQFEQNAEKIQFYLYVRADDKIYSTCQIGENSALMAELSDVLTSLLTPEWKW